MSDGSWRTLQTGAMYAFGWQGKTVTARVVRVEKHPHYGDVAILDRKASPRRVVASRLTGKDIEEIAAGKAKAKSLNGDCIPTQRVFQRRSPSKIERMDDEGAT
jgi:hypothetical protein